MDATNGSTRGPKDETKAKPPLVRFRDRRGVERVGKLVGRGRKWITIEYKGGNMKLPIEHFVKEIT